MKLNDFERSVVRSRARRILQDRVEAPLLLSLYDKGPGPCAAALEIGCGFGNGVDFIRRRLGAERVTAVDLDPAMVQSTRDRYAHEPWFNAMTADATDLPFADGSFDLVCNFAVFHHIPNWQGAVAEVYRVLTPSGYFLLTDLYRSAICNPIARRLFDHPQQNRFDHKQFLAEARRCGFEPVGQRNFCNLAGQMLLQKVVTQVRP
ncbi:class I SAM-dependent methyltransferase [Shewanella cyperi]|uniref:Class I SAM-dependent methyltransferase n=1 Tax=Shewanella cyperi TaxID=2814292 RepID=A0A975AJG2_9GAMM|nr:class I SAM-dependent methyltransferase [Shewanella cyperi]QSX28681.1 class I SAM-dependent methyltransferase [Shewanella cyperi]